MGRRKGEGTVWKGLREESLENGILFASFEGKLRIFSWVEGYKAQESAYYHVSCLKTSISHRVSQLF
jgi:hypothetical protein